LSAVGEELESTTREVKTHFSDIDRDTRKVIKRIKEGAGQDYYAHRVEKAGVDADKFEIRISVAALFMIDEVVQPGVMPATSYRNRRSTSWPCGPLPTSGWNWRPRRPRSLPMTAMGEFSEWAKSNRPGVYRALHRKAAK